MARVVTRNASMAQLQLDSGERVLISITRTEIAVFKLGFFGSIPLYKIWAGTGDDFIQRSYKPASYTMFALDPVRFLINDLLIHRSIEEMSNYLNKKSV